jgi:pyruvate formate lyase activating enzyme
MIGGFHSFSFIDYPGIISCVVFMRGCNLRCPYCHNPSLLVTRGDPFMSRHDLLSFLEKRRGRLEGVVITGGEPTLHPGLRQLIESVRSLGFQVKLDTNGTRPQVISDLLADHLLDLVAMDLKDDPYSYAEWLGMQAVPEHLIRSIEIIKASGIDHELRTTIVLPRHDESRLVRMATFAVGAHRWVLQPCRTETTLVTGIRLGSPTDSYIEELAANLRRTQGVNCVCRGTSWRESASRHEEGHQPGGAGTK